MGGGICLTTETDFCGSNVGWVVGLFDVVVILVSGA